MFEIPREKTRRWWTVPLSMAGELLAVGILVTMPVAQVQVLPAASMSGMISLALPPPPPPPPPPPAAGRQEPVTTVVRRIEPAKLMSPVVPEVPDETELVSQNSEGADFSGGVVGGVPGGVPGGVIGGVVGGTLGGVLGGILKPLPPVVPPPPPVVVAAPPAPAPPSRVSVGGKVQEALLLRQVMPLYPRLAKSGRITGIVRLKAIIGRDGKVENLTLISGHPLLVRAAEDAVSQWVYRPTLLNGVPVEVETDINVTFSLRGLGSTVNN